MQWSDRSVQIASRWLHGTSLHSSAKTLKETLSVALKRQIPTSRQEPWSAVYVKSKDQPELSKPYTAGRKRQAHNRAGGKFPQPMKFVLRGP